MADLARYEALAGPLPKTRHALGFIEKCRKTGPDSAHAWVEWALDELLPVIERLEREITEIQWDSQ